MNSGKIVKEYDMENQLISRTKDVISKFEKEDIKEQTNLFELWGKERQSLLEKQISEFKRKTKKAALAKRLLELQEKEEKISYFEQLDQIKIGIKRKPVVKPIEDAQKKEIFVPPPQERGKYF